MKKCARAYTLLAVAALCWRPILASPIPETHHGRGVILAIQDQGRVLVIKHRAIAGYMEAMTMPFELAGPGLARDLKVGDAVRFTITRRGDFLPITEIKVLKPPKRSAPPAKPPVGLRALSASGGVAP